VAQSGDSRTRSGRRSSDQDLAEWHRRRHHEGPHVELRERVVDPARTQVERCELGRDVRRVDAAPEATTSWRRKPCGSRNMTCAPIPRGRRVARGRTQRLRRRRHDHGRHSTAQERQAGHERLHERRAPIAINGGEQVQDLQALARAPVGRQVDDVGPGRVRPTARFSESARSATAAATRTATSTLESSPEPDCTRRSRSTKSQTSAVCSRSNSLTWISPVRAVDGQWIRLKRVARRVGPDRGGERRCLLRPDRRGSTPLEAHRTEPPAGDALDPR